MNLSAVTGSRGRYYSSVQGEDENKSFKRTPLAKPTRSKSPTKRKDFDSKNNPSSIPRAVTTSIHSASQRVKNTARTLTPKRFLLSPCLSRDYSNKSGRRLGNDSYQDDDITPVIFYADEDASARRSANEMSFVDPFAIEGKRNPPPEPKKEVTKVRSPTSVMSMGLFTVEEESFLLANCSSESEEEEAVFFDDPFFPRSLTRVFDENTSIDLSEGIKSINAMSVSDGVLCGEQGQAGENAEASCESPEQWFGFFTSENYVSYEWDPELEDKSFE